MIDPNMMADGADAPEENQGKFYDREDPKPSQARKALVSSMTQLVTNGKTHWDKVFRRMAADQKFAAGHQWPSETKSAYFNDDYDDRYVANIVLRHIQQKVAALYAKNPKSVARRRKRLLTSVWDGSIETLKMAQSLLQQAQEAQSAMMAPPQIDPMTGAPMPPPPPPPPEAIQQAQSLVEDAQQAKQQLDLEKKVAQTLEILYQYEIDSQQQPFKSMMKMVLRRAATSGVGWIKVGFQRVMGKNPDFDTHLADLEQRLSLIERVSADIADGEIDPNAAEAEQLRLAMTDLMNEQDVVLREGLQLSYPKPTAIIVDPRCVNLREFLGCDWVAEEFMLSPNEVKETYGVDVGKHYTAYKRTDIGTDYEKARAIWQGTYDGSGDTNDQNDGDSCVVWEIFNKKDGLVYVVCDGYQDFLREPASPDAWTERFWPWYPVMFNECDGQIYPPSDVQLMKSMQLELNRTRQGMREHRFANRPKLAYAEGLLSAEDLESLKTHPVNALIAISGLQPGQDIKQVLQPISGVPFDNALYETNPIFQDMLRAVGDQEANLGGTTDATATQSQIAQQSRATSQGSSADDLDETLSAIAKAAGEILILNVGEETVKEIVGPGAVWPTLTKAEVAKNVFLDVEASSSGKPDQQLEIMNFEKIGPILMQIEGITPQFLAKEALRRLDDKLDINEALSEGAPSIMARNAAASKPAGGPAGPMPAGQGAKPGAQGPQGSSNAPAPPSPNPSAPGANAGAPPNHQMG